MISNTAWTDCLIFHSPNEETFSLVNFTKPRTQIEQIHYWLKPLLFKDYSCHLKTP